LIAAVFGVLAGGFIADRLQRRYVYGRLVAMDSRCCWRRRLCWWRCLSDDKRVVLGGLFVAGFSCPGITVR
jgi:hypothetical protein